MLGNLLTLLYEKLRLPSKVRIVSWFQKTMIFILHVDISDCPLRVRSSYISLVLFMVLVPLCVHSFNTFFRISFICSTKVSADANPISN